MRMSAGHAVKGCVCSEGATGTMPFSPVLAPAGFDATFLQRGSTQPCTSSSNDLQPGLKHGNRAH
ncbi:MAG: hypothetical protein ABI858_03945, partial [Pseudoxanthomonas sp.]